MKQGWLKAVIAGAIAASLTTACSGAPKSSTKATEPPTKTVTETALAGRSFGGNTSAPTTNTAPMTAAKKPSDFGKVRDKHGTVYAQVEYLNKVRVPFQRRNKEIGYVDARAALKIRFTGDHKGIKLGTSPVRVYDRAPNGDPVPYPTAYRWVDGTTVLVTGWNGFLPEQFRIAAYRVVNNREVSRVYLDLDRIQVSGKPFEVVKEDGKVETDPNLRRVAWFEVKTTTKRVPA